VSHHGCAAAPEIKGSPFKKNAFSKPALPPYPVSKLKTFKTKMN